MSEENKSSTASPMGKRLVQAGFFGALTGLLFSSPGIDLAIFKDFSPIVFLQGLAGGLVLFGLPAGVILGFLDSRSGNTTGWQAVIKVPAIFVGGIILLFGVLAIPLAIGVVAKSGSEWLTSGADSPLLMRFLGVLAGSCFGLILGAILIANESIQAKWPESDSPKQTADHS